MLWETVITHLTVYKVVHKQQQRLWRRLVTARRHFCVLQLTTWAYFPIFTLICLSIFKCKSVQLKLETSINHCIVREKKENPQS